MKKVLIALLIVIAFTSCKKGLIFDKEMVIGDWRMWELYSPDGTYYWTFTEDSVFIYLEPFSVDSNKEQSFRELVYRQSNWNTGNFDIDLFTAPNPFDSTKHLSCFIDIAKYHRNYLVINADKYNWSASLGRIEE